MAVTLKQLLLLNPESFKSQFIANNSYVLSEEALQSVKKIRNRYIKAKIIALDTYRKKLARDRKENKLYSSSSELMLGNYGNYAFRMFITRY